MAAQAVGAFLNFVRMDLIILSIPIFLLLLLVEISWDVISHKKNERVYRLNDAIANISCGILDQVSGVFAKVFTVGAFVLVYEHFGANYGFHFEANFLNYALCFIGADLAYYWAHRLSHQVNILWTGHVVHHQSEEYNLSVALRQGAVQKLLTFWVYLPLALLGFKPEWFAASIAINLLYQFWIHTESVKTMGILEYVLNTPSHHRVHHGRNPKYIDKNHAGVFIIWDKLFGTFQKEEEHPTYGITHPVNTFNAVESHVQPYSRLIKELQLMPGLINKFKFLFKAPGWYPQELGGFQLAPEVLPSDKKFDVILPVKVHYYVIIQFIIMLSMSSWFLFSAQNIIPIYQILFFSYILFYLFSIGSVLNATNYAKITEVVKLILLCGVAWLISPVALYIGLFLSVISLVWVYFVPLKPVEIIYQASNT